MKHFKIFQRELKALSKCNHNNVIKLIGAGYNENKTFFLVLEKAIEIHLRTFVQNDILKNWYKKRIISLELIKLLGELSQGLFHMEKAGILHRDLQINNILVFENEKGKIDLKICDFGVSAFEEDKHSVCYF